MKRNIQGWLKAAVLLGLLYVNLHIGSFLALSESSTTTDSKAKLTVLINGVNNNNGDLIVLLFDEKHASAYPQKMNLALSVTTHQIKENKAAAIFEELPSGNYAIFVIHDENKNKLLDTNFIGRPKEGTGASNDAHGVMGPPKFAKAVFAHIHNGTEIAIKVRYM